VALAGVWACVWSAAGNVPSARRGGPARRWWSTLAAARVRRGGRLLSVLAVFSHALPCRGDQLADSAQEKHRGGGLPPRAVAGGNKKPDTGLIEATQQAGGLTQIAGEPVRPDGDDIVETATWLASFGDQVGQPAVPWDSQGSDREAGRLRALPSVPPGG
jgi:hypothetical protein